MIIKFLRLYNFGLYGGCHEFDLAPNKSGKKPVILIKGHNGAGKTTFLEAVRLALYGKRALGARVSQTDYENHLIRRIHTPSEERHAWVELEFESSHSGRMEIFRVRREWTARGQTLVDTLWLFRDGLEVSDIPREDWDHYLEDLIPAGVSQLFFFDGEKIQDIADDQGSLGLFEAIRSLLGLDLIDQLRGDLALYKARSNETTDQTDLEAIMRDLEVAKRSVERQDELSASLTTQRKQIAKRSERAQQKFKQEGGTFALDRDTLQNEITIVEKELASAQNSLKALVNGSAPFSLAPKLTKQFCAEVERAKGAQFEKSVRAFVTAFQETVSIKSRKNPTWTDKHFDDLTKFASATSGADDVVELTSEPDWALEQLSNIPDDRVEAAKLGFNLDSLWKKRALLRQQLKNFRPGAAASAFEALKQAEFELGAIDNELGQAKAEAQRLRDVVTRLDADRIKARDAQFDYGNAKERMDLATRTQSALAIYEQRILQTRLISLSKFFVEAFNGLVNRKTLVKRVDIDPDTFAISLLGEADQRIDTSELSAGERQLYAISMLWALGRTSGRELPMIIDTPLSRLDSVHREALMGQYLPNAGEQVIMLCTDTELTDDIAALIEPYVSQNYEIGVEEKTNLTSISKKSKSKKKPSRRVLIDAR
jgi:DNA sulfur modification protein DndD